MLGPSSLTLEGSVVSFHTCRLTFPSMAPFACEWSAGWFVRSVPTGLRCSRVSLSLVSDNFGKWHCRHRRVFVSAPSLRPKQSQSTLFVPLLLTSQCRPHISEYPISYVDTIYYIFLYGLSSVFGFRFVEAYEYIPARYQFNTTIQLYTGILPTPT